MSKSRSLILLLLSLLILGISLYQTKYSSPISSSSSPKDSYAPVPIKHYLSSDVQLGISKYPPKPLTMKTPPIKGGVVPHHLVAQLSLAAYFQNLSLYPYKRVILLGPNHENVGDSAVTTSLNPWETPYGLVSADQEKIKDLTCATLDTTVINSEHSHEVLMPFIKTYLPSSLVIPIHLKRSLNLSELEKLSNCLLPLIDDQTLVLASVDFSHYLSSEEAAQKDRETLGLIKNHEYQRLLSLTPAHLDSPPSLVLLLLLMQGKNTNILLEVANHTDAALLTNHPNEATTTHYYLNYYAQ